MKVVDPRLQGDKYEFIRNQVDIDYITKKLKVVRDVSFKARGKCRFSRRSGCGKTTLAKTIMRLLPDNGVIALDRLFIKVKI